MAVLETIPKVLVVLLGDVYRILSAMYATNDISNAHIRYWKGEIDTLVLVNESTKACQLDISPKKVPVASIDKWKPRTTPGWRIDISAKTSIVRLETSLTLDETFNIPVGAAS
jgi:hypothetical protein